MRRIQLILCFVILVIPSLKSYQGLATESYPQAKEEEEVYPQQIHGLNASGGASVGRETSRELEAAAAAEELNASSSAASKGSNRGGRNTGGGYAQIVRQPPSHRRNGAPTLSPPPPLIIPLLRSMCASALFAVFF